MTMTTPAHYRLSRTTILSGGASRATLVGGMPVTLMRLAPTSSSLIDAQRRIRVGPESPPAAGALARRLTDAGLAFREVADAEPSTYVELCDLAIVVPVHDPAVSLHPLKLALHDVLAAGAELIIVDDGSADPVRATAGATLIRHEVARGPAAARNAGAREACSRGRHTVAFLDADVVPLSGWLEPLLAHLREPGVVLAAPRIVAAYPRRFGVAGFETARSALDMGPEPAPVRPRGMVPYVPSAAFVLRLDRLPVVGDADAGPEAAPDVDPDVDPDAPFDESMRVAEDVDLCWRLHRGGARLRYEPAARVAHRHRLDASGMLARRELYGTGAARLAADHGDAVAPAVFSAQTLATVALLWWGRRWSTILAALLAADSARRVHRTTRNPVLTARLVSRSLAGAFRQLPSAMLRPYWPVTAVMTVVALPSKRTRRLAGVVGVAAVVEALDHWWGCREPRRLPADEPLGHVILHRLDDFAYGAGVWRSAIAGRSAAALRPDLRW